MEEAIASLVNSEFWKDTTYSKLKDYMNKYWLSIKEVRNTLK